MFLNILLITVEYVSPCVQWRQTSGCRPDGPRNPAKDQDCDILIDDSWSGYCECTDGQVVMEKGCISGKYKTCNDACLDHEGTFLLLDEHFLCFIYRKMAKNY